MSKQLPNIYIVQIVSGICIILAGILSTMIIGSKLLYMAGILIEFSLITIMINAIIRRDTKYVYTMVGSIVCIMALVFVIGKIIEKQAALA